MRFVVLEYSDIIWNVEDLQYLYVVFKHLEEKKTFAREGATPHLDPYLHT